MRSILKLTLLLLAVFSAAFTHGLAHAGLQEEMQNMFDGMVNSTTPSAYRSQGRGVLSGGSLTMNHRVSRPTLVTFRPPSIRAGCGGINMFGGSFSMIDADQFIQFAKDVAQDAAGYAFKLAIEGMCPTCAQQMDALQKKVQEMNSWMKSSCESAKKLVNSTNLDEWHAERMKEANQAKVNDSVRRQDLFSAEARAKTDGPTAGLNEADKAKFERNVVWEALNNSAIGSWFASGADENMMRVMMSLTGTAIVKRGADMESRESLVMIPKKPIMNFQHVLNGAGTNTSAYYCPSGDIKCLDMDEGPIMNFPGMIKLVNMMLYGSYEEPADGDIGNGILRKLNERGGSTMTTAERNFLAAARPPVLALLRNLATDSNALKFLARELTEVIAVQTAASFAFEAINSIELAVQANWKSDSGKLLENIKGVKAELYKEVDRTQQMVANLKDKILVAQYAEQILTNRGMTGRRVYVGSARGPSS